MNFAAWSAVFNMVVALPLGVFILLQNTTSKKHIAFFLTCLDVFFWSFFYVFWQVSTTAEWAIFYVRALVIFSILFPPLIYNMTINFLDVRTLFHKRLLKFCYGFSSLLVAINLVTPHFVKSVSPKGGFPFWPSPGWAFELDNLNFSVPVVTGFYLLWDFRRKSSPAMKNYVTGILMAYIFGYTCLFTNMFLWYDIDIYPFGTAGAGLFMVFLAILFFKAGMFDPKTFLRDTISFVITTAFLGGAVALVVEIITKDDLASVAVFFSVFFIPVIYQRLHRHVKAWIQKIGLGGATQYLKAMDTTLEKIKETTYTYDDLARNIVSSVLNTFPVQMAAVYFYDLNKKEMVLRAQKGMKNPSSQNLLFNRSVLAIPEMDPLLAYIQIKKEVLIRDELIIVVNKSAEVQKPVITSMERIEAEVSAPLVVIGQVKGLLILGKKKNNDAFNEEDRDAIAAFARMGEEIMRYIISMETELRNTALYSHDMHHDTKALLQTFGFLSSPMAQKQPLEKLQTILRQAEAVANHLNNIVEANRDRSHLIMRSIRGEYELVPTDVVPLVKGSCGKYALTANEAKIKLEMALVPDLPSVMGQPDDLNRVIDNLINNALRHTPEGGRIEVKAGVETDSVLISVQDSGEGIDPDELDKIWEMGWQGKGAKKGTSGFGLSIVKQIIDFHHGTIAAKSEGPGKGTTFVVHLPKMSSDIKVG